MMRPDLHRFGNHEADVDVGRLRAKVDRWHIETVRNVGYCFSG
jgi:DNA-binding response OmpR family regulator